ncbi:MAG: PAS domain-containing protein [Desulfovibrio sp.]|nr:PAS domain-containing protein [Desulfovibrio sp.]
MEQRSSSLPTDLGFWKEKQIFDVLPVPAAVLDADLEIILANKRFIHTFGPWEGQKCWEAYHKTTEPCKHKSCARSFEKREPVVSRGEGITSAGQSIHYTKYTLPLMVQDGKVSHILEICIDNTSSDILRHEYQSLFDLVPCYIVVLDRDLRIIDTNRMVRDIWGDLEGRQCFRALKGQEFSCANCTARRSFVNKSPQYDMQPWITPEGEVCSCQVAAVPITDETGKVTATMEMATDVTELTYLREQTEIKNLMLAEIVNNSQRGLAIISDEGDIPIFNPPLVKMLGLPAIGISDPEELYALLPDKVNAAIASGAGSFFFSELPLFSERGDDVLPVNLQGVRLKVGKKSLGLLLTFDDLRSIKKLEKAKMEAERMAAVGHTVSGLAHGVKNLVTALEGGMYLLSSGMQGDRPERIAQGMNMLQRNIDRIGGFVKSFLDFARSREIRTRYCDPAAVAVEVAELYRVKARQHDIDLRLDARQGVPQAPLDYESLHEALTNLVGNAIDACIMTEEGKKCHIDIRFHEDNGTLAYEVQDNGCGMDAATKKKIFSNFFTTKGEGGTGLGLLMTKKLIREHGGTIDLDSEVGKGTIFTIRLPRASLPLPQEEENA